MKKLTALLIPLLIAVLFCGCVTNAQLQSYNAGVAAYEAKDHEAAKAYFIAAEGYGNSASYLSAIAEYERIYLEALGFFDARDYEAARNSFSAISEFGNSAEYLAFIDKLEQRYEEGLSAYRDQDLVTAYERFVQAMGYADSADYALNISKLEDNYQIAKGFMREGNYAQALGALDRIGVPYRDSEEMREQIYLLMAKKGMTAVLFREFFNDSFKKTGEDTRLPISETSETGFAWKATNGLMIVGNTDEEGYIKTISFWVEKDLQKELGEEGVNRLFAHCIDAMARDGEGLDAVLSEIELYFEGVRFQGSYRFLLDEDDSGAEVLTATFVEG